MVALPARVRALRRALPEVNGMKVVATGAALILGYLILVPLVMQVLTAFRGPHLPFAATAQTGIDNFLAIYTTGRFTSTFIDTGIFVGGAVLLSFAIGFVLAWLVERTNLPARNLWFVIILVPAIMPGIVQAQAWMLMLGPQHGIVNQAIRLFLPFWETGPINPFTMPAMILVQGIGGVTFFFLLLSAVLRNMDGGLEEASRASGASTFNTLRRVTFPILAPGIVAVVLLNFIITVGQFEVPLLLGIGAGANIFSIRIWRALQPDVTGVPSYGVAAAFGVSFLVMTYALFYIYLRFNRVANRFATITGKGYRPALLNLGVWKVPALLFLVGYLAIAFAVPFLTLFWSSLVPFYTAPSWETWQLRGSFDAYGHVLREASFWGGLWRSFFVAALSATIAVTLAMIMAWVVVRGGRGLLYRALDLVATSSVAIPASIAALAFFIFYIMIGNWVPIWGTIWVLVLAYSFRTAVAYRNSYAGVVQINRELEEASIASGASHLATMRRVIVPLLLPHAMVAWLLLFLLGMHEFTMAIFLTTERSQTLPVVLFNRLSSAAGGRVATDEAGAMAVVFTVLTAIVIFGMRWVISRRGVQRSGGR